MSSSQVLLLNMGKRRGRTGPGGAVVSSLSQNAGGTIKNNRRNGNDQNNQNQPGASNSGPRWRREDPELLELAGVSNNKNPGPSQASSASGSAGGSKWLGKSPQQMLKEWCTRNNRIRP